MIRKHYYANVVRLGNIAVSRHAADRLDEDKITSEEFERALLEPLTEDVPDGIGVLWRERDGIRIVILERPEPFRGAKLVKTVYRIKAKESVF